MKTSSKMATIAMTVSLFACSNALKSTQDLDRKDRGRLEQLEAQVKAIKAKEIADERIGQYILNMMFKSEATIKGLSPARMQVLARAITRVGNDIFDNEEQKKAFIMALQIESKFLKYAQSPTGPKGLAQVAKATFHYALKRCGAGTVNDDDVWETDLNLYAGACYFKEQLLDPKNDNDPYFAIISYNQGPASVDAKGFPKTGHLTEVEPLKYLAKYTFLDRTTTDKRAPGVPAIGELPKASKKK